MDTKVEGVLSATFAGAPGRTECGDGVDEATWVYEAPSPAGRHAAPGFLMFCESHERPARSQQSSACKLALTVMMSDHLRRDHRQPRRCWDGSTTIGPACDGGRVVPSPRSATSLIEQHQRHRRDPRQAGNAPPGRSCLFAKTRRRQSFISRSLKILRSSCFASSMRSRSCSARS